MKFVRLPKTIRRNIVVSAPTGVGKTTAVLKNLDNYTQQFNRVFILLPTKALIYQVSKQIPNALRDDSDARLDQEISARDWFRSKVIVTSYERADSMFLMHPSLARNSLIVIDEIHLATTERALSILSILANVRDTAKFILMSATIPNLHDLARYLNAEVIAYKDKVNREVLLHNIGCRPNNADTYNHMIVEKIIEIISSNPKVPTIVFRPSRRQCDALASLISARTNAVAMPFHSGLDKKVREKLIEDFIQGKIDVLVATTSLAYGVNTPAERVIIGGLTFPSGEHIKTVDIVQMMGRAGRPGFSNRAEVHIIYFAEEENIAKCALNGQYLESIGLFSHFDTIIVRMIKSGKIRSLNDVYAISENWFNAPPEHYLEQALKSLIEERIVKDNLRLTKIGHLIAKHYITVDTYRVLKPLIVQRPNSRKLKLEMLAEAVFALKPSSYFTPSNSFLANFSENARKILAQLLYRTGDTAYIAETIKKLSSFLYDATKDKDWYILAESMSLLRRSLRYNQKIDYVIKRYLNRSIDPLISSPTLKLRNP